MPKRRAILPAILAVILAVATGTTAMAQRDICDELEAQLAAIDAAPASHPADTGRLERAIAETARAFSAARMQFDRAGCRPTRFLFFQPRRPAACEALDSRMRAIEHDLTRLQAERARSAADPTDSAQRSRRQILVALTRHGCGGGYAEDRRNTVFGMLYGESTRNSFGHGDGDGYRYGMPGETYRTLCVRACDGFYWPISFTTVPGRFNEDARVCQASCPQAEVSLYVHRNPGEGIDQATSLSGAPYSALPSAFRYRKEYDAQCSCGRTLPRIALAEASNLSIAVTDVELPLIAAPLPRPRPGGAPPRPREAAAERLQENSAEGTDAPASRDGRPVRVIGPGFTYYRADDG